VTGDTVDTDPLNVTHLSWLSEHEDTRDVTRLTDVGYVDCNGVRLWCDTVEIDNEAPFEIGGRPIRQIRGRLEGMLAFTKWIEPDVKARIRRKNPHGLTITAGDVCLDVVRANSDRPMKIERTK
jgi:hypothetical protein